MVVMSGSTGGSRDGRDARFPYMDGAEGYGAVRSEAKWMSGEGANLCGIGPKDVSFLQSLVSVSESDVVSDKLVSVSCGNGADWEEHFCSTHATFSF